MTSFRNLDVIAAFLAGAAVISPFAVWKLIELLMASLQTLFGS